MSNSVVAPSLGQLANAPKTLTHSDMPTLKPNEYLVCRYCGTSDGLHFPGTFHGVGSVGDGRSIYEIRKEQ